LLYFPFYFEIISFLSTIKFISFLKTPYQLSVKAFVIFIWSFSISSDLFW